MAAKDTTYKILMLPYLGHGHIHPFLELAKKLSSRNFRIFFCSTPAILDSISIGGSSILPVELRLPSSPELPPHYHAFRNVPPRLVPLLVKALQKARPRFADIIDEVKPDLIIHDLCQSWAAKYAASHGIPAVCFQTGGAASCSFFNFWYIQGVKGTAERYPYNEISLRDSEIRNLMALTESLEFDEEDISYVSECEIILVKSCRGIEGKYMEYLSILRDRKILPTGPLIASDESNGQRSEILNWLDRKSERSTLYISFGSENYLSEGQIGEIAKALEMIEVNFILVVRSPVGSESFITEALPDGFLGRTNNRGMVVQEWAPQAAILAHSSVGGFMSHCGWGSMIESVYFGVPIVALPLKIDQPLNARLMTAAGAGVEVERGGDGEIDAKEVAKTINKIFGEDREDFRKRVREMSEKMKMEEDQDIDEIAKELSRICVK